MICVDHIRCVGKLNMVRFSFFLVKIFGNKKVKKGQVLQRFCICVLQACVLFVSDDDFLTIYDVCCDFRCIFNCL